MPEYIKRSDALKALETMESIEDGLTAINDIPAADVVEVKHGRWVYVSGDFESRYECSECERFGESNWKRCPYCGAKMDGKGGDPAA